MNSENAKQSFESAAEINYLTEENCSFFKNGDFPGAKIILKDKTEKTFERIFLHRNFPFDMPQSFVSVLDADQEEIGLIKDIDLFKGENLNIIADELKRCYYTPEIIKIFSIKESRGFSAWKIETDGGNMSITLQDTRRSIRKISEKSLIITDMCGGRYMISDLDKLDKKSVRKIDIYI